MPLLFRHLLPCLVLIAATGVPAAELDAAVDEIVQDLLAGGPNALAASKQLLARVRAMNLDEAFDWTARLSGALFRSEEATEGMAAYLGKRPAAWVPNDHENQDAR